MEQEQHPVQKEAERPKGDIDDFIFSMMQDKRESER